MNTNNFYRYLLATVISVITIAATSNAYSYELPENTLRWETIPSAIRADGNDSFVIEVYSPQPVSSIKLSKMPSVIDDGAYVKPVSGYFFSSIALKDDGVDGDRIAGDNIYTAGPFVYDTTKAFPADGLEGIDGIFNDAVGELEITFTDNQYKYEKNGTYTSIGLLRADVEDVETIDLNENIQASPYVINMVDNNFASERRLRMMHSYNSYEAGYDQAKELYSVLSDDFDQLLVYSTATLNDVSGKTMTSVRGVHYIVNNQIQGLGLNVFDHSADYGSSGKLTGINYFSQGRLDSALAVHEITHQWEAHLDSPIDGITIENGGHWSSFVSWYSTKEWEENYDGTYTLRYRDNPLDKQMLKYLMGYSYYSEISDELHVADINSEGVFSQNQVITKTTYDFTMEDIIAKNGIRTPGPENAQRNFKAAVIFSTANRKFNPTEMTFASIYAQNIGSKVGKSLFDSTWITALPAFPDTVPPVLTLNGEVEINVIVDSEFTDPGVIAIDNVDGDISELIIIDGTVDTAILGSYEITYNVIDSSGNNAEQVIRTVNVIEEPVCEAITATNSEHEAAGRAYNETVTEGETCYGTWCFGGTEVTTWYAVGSDENLGTDGNITTILHEVADGEFVQGVCAGPDLTAPVITLLGDNPLIVIKGSSFVDPGATAVDNIDGDLTAAIEVKGSVNTNTLGTYQLIYEVSDAAGNTTSVDRAVKIIEAPTCQEFTDTVANHESAGRAYSQTETTGETCYGTFCWGGTTTTVWYADGSDENLGTNGSASVTLKTSAGGYVTGNCPTDPQPPVIESYEISELSYNSAVVTGIASDSDGDIDRVVLGLGAVSGVICEGTTNFTCILDYSEHNIEVGVPLAVSLTAWDSRDVRSIEVQQFSITRPEQQASVPPVISNLNYTVSGQSMLVTVNVVDQDLDLSGVRLEYADQIGQIECDNTEGSQYTCDLTFHGLGIYSFKVAAYDNASNKSETAPFTVEFIEVGECVTDTNFNHVEAGRAYVGGLSNLYAYGIGSDDDLGLYGSTYYSVSTSLEETAVGVWSMVDSCQ